MAFRFETANERWSWYKQADQPWRMPGAWENPLDTEVYEGALNFYFDDGMLPEEAYDSLIGEHPFAKRTIPFGKVQEMYRKRKGINAEAEKNDDALGFSPTGLI